MPEFASRMVLAVEAIIFCLPVSALFLFAGLPGALYSAASTDGLTMVVACLVIILPTLFCAWVLIFAFVFRGNASLQRLSIYWWALPFLCSSLAVAAISHLAFVSEFEPSVLNLFGWGVPLLIPLAHLCFERWFRPGANTSFKQTLKRRP
jgi:hypothetical protein